MTKSRSYLLGIFLIILYLGGQYSAWTVQMYDYVNNYMYEFTSPKVRSMLSAGYDSLFADLSLIRGIQFYGRNYPLLDKHPVKYDQFHALGKTVSEIDDRYSGAYRFWGFALTSAERGKVDAYRHLIHGAERLMATDEVANATRPAFGGVIPELWRVAKDAGYVAVYELHSATPEWGCTAYKMAQKSPECPDFIPRLEYFACKAIEPDPLPHLMELVQDAAKTNNEAIKVLNIDHIRRIVSQEHMTFWNIAEKAYKEIHGASATSIKDLKSVQIMKIATQRYREASAKWFTDGRTTRLYPNLLNPEDAEKTQPVVKEAVEPELPIDPYGGEYYILPIDGTPTLTATGPCLEERRDYLTILGDALVEYKKKNKNECPKDIQSMEKSLDDEIFLADMLGYPVIFDQLSCSFSFPDISEEAPPMLTPYGKGKEEVDQLKKDAKDRMLR